MPPEQLATDSMQTYLFWPVRIAQLRLPNLSANPRGTFQDTHLCLIELGGEPIVEANSAIVRSA